MMDVAEKVVERASTRDSVVNRIFERIDGGDKKK